MGNKIVWGPFTTKHLYIIISDEIGVTEGNIQIEIEPHGLWPVKYFNHPIEK